MCRLLDDKGNEAQKFQVVMCSQSEESSARADETQLAQGLRTVWFQKERDREQCGPESEWSNGDEIERAWSAKRDACPGGTETNRRAQ